MNSLTYCRWRTKIVLSLKESHLTSNMAKKFNDIQPSLLLFLHRLRSITVQDEVQMYLLLTIHIKKSQINISKT